MMNKPESNRTTESLSASEERIIELFDQLADALEDLQKLTNSKFNYTVNWREHIQAYVIPLFKAIHTELINLQSTHPEKTRTYYNRLKIHIDYYNNYYPDLFTFWNFNPDTQTTPSRINTETIAIEAEAILEEKPNYELDSEHKEKIDKFCEICKMPIPFAEACSIACKGKKDFENTLLYLWFVNRPAENPEFSNGDKAAELFNKAYIGSGDTLAYLKELEHLITEEYSETKLIIALADIGMEKSQMEAILRIVRVRGEKIDLHEKIEVTRPKWVLIRGLILKCQKQNEEKNHFLQNRLLVKDNETNTENDTIENATNKAVTLLKEAEKNLKRGYDEFVKAKKTDYKIDDLELLPQFIALDLKDYQEALRTCLKYDRNAAIKSYKDLSEVIDYLYGECQEVMPVWTVSIDALTRPEAHIVKAKLSPDELAEMAEIKDYKKNVEKARLTLEQREKMLALADQITAATNTAKEVEPTSPIPTKTQILKSLNKLTQRTIELIANAMVKPGIVIVPYRINDDESAQYLSSYDIIESMNFEALRHHKGQKKIKNEFPAYTDEIYTKVRVSIVEMTPSLETTDHESHFKTSDRHIIKEFSEKKDSYLQNKGLRLCSLPEYLLAAQQQIMTGDETNYLDSTRKNATLFILHSDSRPRTNICLYWDQGYVIKIAGESRYMGVRPAYTLIEWE